MEELQGLQGILSGDFDEAQIMGISEEELGGAIEALPRKKKGAIVKKAAKNKTAAASAPASNPAPVALNSRNEFNKRLSQLPTHIAAGIKAGRMQACDVAYYAAKSIAGVQSVSIFRQDDAVAPGVCNLAQAKLPSGNPMLLHSIQLLSAEGVAGKPVSEANFKVISDIIRNGDMLLRVSTKTVIPGMSCEVFCTTGSMNKQGVFVLDNPKMIQADHVIELEVKWGSAAPANTFIKAVLMGTGVANN